MASNWQIINLSFLASSLTWLSLDETVSTLMVLGSGFMSLESHQSIHHSVIHGLRPRIAEKTNETSQVTLPPWSYKWINALNPTKPIQEAISARIKHEQGNKDFPISFLHYKCSAPHQPRSVQRRFWDRSHRPQPSLSHISTKIGSKTQSLNSSRESSPPRTSCRGRHDSLGARDRTPRRTSRPASPSPPPPPGLLQEDQTPTKKRKTRIGL